MTIAPISQNAKAIVFAPDNFYCKYFSVALRSLIDNADSGSFYDIILLATDISERNSRLLHEMLPENFSLRIFNINDFIKEQLGNFKLTAKNHWSISTFYRLFIPMLMPDYEKVLYLDSDICILDSLCELFDTDFDDAQMIAVQDCDTPYFLTDTTRLNQLTNILKIKNPSRYFNAGMTFFNIKNIDVNKYLEDLKQAFKAEKLYFLDQDILNMIFEDSKKLVSCKWNFQYHIPMYHPDYIDIITEEYKKEYLEASQNPCIIHFTSEIKPWANPHEELAEYFWKYARRIPYYEEILYTNLVTKHSLKQFWKRNKIFLTLAKCKFFAKISTGTKRIHYEAKTNRYQRMLNELSAIK